MANYYCIMAGLPELQLSDTKPGYSIAQLREELQAEIGRYDERLLQLLFFRHDCQNLVDLLRTVKDVNDLKDFKDTIDQEGNYTCEQLAELVEDARGIDLGTSVYPQFMRQFVADYDQNASREDYYPEDEVLLAYYDYCTKHCSDSLMRRWYQLNYDVTNIMTAMIARRQGWKVSDYVKGDGEVQEMIRTNDAKDFNLGSLLPYIPEIMKIVDEEDPVKKEKMLDAFKWMWLDEQTFADTFSIEAVFAYLCKLEIQERWAQLDVEQGKETFEKIINELRSEAQVPEEFIRK